MVSLEYRFPPCNVPLSLTFLEYFVLNGFKFNEQGSLPCTKISGTLISHISEQQKKYQVQSPYKVIRKKKKRIKHITSSQTRKTCLKELPQNRSKLLNYCLELDK
jgi:hypothetical protein